MRLAILFAAASLLGASALAHAPADAAPGPSPTPQVTVTAGQALQLSANDYGPEAVKELTEDLAQAVGKSLGHSRNNEVREAHLVLENATPTRPTAAQLGHNPGLSELSIGLGGAWIDGYVVTADNKKTPIGFSFYETNLRNDLAPAMWSDAERAFDMLVTGKFIDAATALDWGLINEVVPAAQLEAASASKAAEIAAKSPSAIRHGKALFYRQQSLPLADAYALAGEVMARNMMEADAGTAIDAFLSRRKPAGGD